MWANRANRMEPRNIIQMANNNECLTCRQSNKKTRSSVMCTGCSRRFCQQHHQEHRESIVKKFDGLIEQHNVLRQHLFSENDEENSTKVSLLKKIDEWERDMIKSIQTTAATTKARLLKMINEEKDQIKNSFTLIANQIKKNQSGNDYVETDVQEWQKKLNNCKCKFEQLLITDNNYIDIDVKPIDFDDSISINKKTDVKIRARLPARNRTPSSERKITCKTCNMYFPKSSGYVEFCSADCSENQHDNVICNYTGDGDGMCFHGNCVVLLANGSTKLVKDVRRGDVLRTSSDGSEATVTYVVKTTCANGKASMVTFDSGLIITPWHPIRVNDKWIFPHDIHQEKRIECQEIYNFALDKGHISIINGFECVTLGHNFKGEVIEHPYFGSAKVLEDLRAMDTSNTGFIELSPNSAMRDNKTRLITGIHWLNGNVPLPSPVTC